MTKRYVSKHYWAIKLLPSLVILSCFLIVNIVFATTPKGPTEPTSPLNTISNGTRATTSPKGPPRPTRPRSSTDNGHRGGCSSVKEALTILNPIYGKTVSTRPVFSWFVPETESYPMRLYLYEYNGKGKGEEILDKIPLQSKLGIMNYTFPQEKVALSVGKRYIWQIVLRCDTNNRKKNVIAEAIFEVVDIPASLKSQLKQAKTKQERSELYAQFGFWYDALAEISNDSINAEFQLSLLERIKQSEMNSANALGGRNKKDLEEQAAKLGFVINAEKARQK